MPFLHHTDRASALRFALVMAMMSARILTAAPDSAASTSSATVSLNQVAIPFEVHAFDADQTLPLPTFDDDGGRRRLRSVTVAVEASVDADVAAENDGDTAAASMALWLTGIIVVHVEHLTATQMLGGLTFTDGSVTASDGISGGGTDYWDFGPMSTYVQMRGNTKAQLDAFDGSGVHANIAVAADYILMGAPEAALYVDEMMVHGMVTVTYEYEETCPADIDGSGSVDFTDLLAVLGAWGSTEDQAYDIDGDGLVALDDVLAVLAGFGPC